MKLLAVRSVAPGETIWTLLSVAVAIDTPWIAPKVVALPPGTLRMSAVQYVGPVAPVVPVVPLSPFSPGAPFCPGVPAGPAGPREIGRASCRGRGEISVVAGSFKKK